MLERSPAMPVSAPGTAASASRTRAALRAWSTSLCPSATRRRAASCPRPSAAPVMRMRGIELSYDLPLYAFEIIPGGRVPFVQHKLTVIVSADVVGYSSLMERDEAGTLDRLKANRRTIFDPRVAAHG